MTRWLIILLSIPFAGAQTLFDLAPTIDDEDHLPLTWTAEIGFGYDDRMGTIPGERFQKFIFFGDSLTDTGNIANIVGGSLGDGYPGQSFSNGTTWAGHLVPEVSLYPVTGPVPGGSIDLSFGLSTTRQIKEIQIDQLFTDLRPNLQVTDLDHAFLWGGGNDFLDAFRSSPALTSSELIEVANSGVANLTAATDALSNTHGFRNIVVMGLVDVTQAPSINGFDDEGAAITRYFNKSLQAELLKLPGRARLVWVDSNALLTRAIKSPSSFGLNNVTDSLAPDAKDGVPSTLPPEQHDGFLFYDHIHPTTTFHQVIASFVAQHLFLESKADSANLLTDAALSLDDRFGFEVSGLGKGESRWNLDTSTYENKSGSSRRSTHFIHADLDHALTDNLLLGGELVYTNGDSGHADLETFGFGLDATLRGAFQSCQWEIGAGIGSISGDLDRNYNIGTLEASSSQQAETYTLHAAFRNDQLKIGNRPAYWEVGLKQRFVHRHGARESGASSLDLSYESDTLATTIANLELGVSLTPAISLEFSLNPVLAHHGGDLKVSQANGFGAFQLSDHSGYDVHTARLTARGQLSDQATIGLNLMAGSDDTWAAGVDLSFAF